MTDVVVDARFWRELRDGARQGVLIAAVVALGLPAYHLLHRAAPVTSAPARAPLVRHLDWQGQKAPADVQQVAQWIVADADNGDMPFAIVDKRGAHVYVFTRDGGLMGATQVLLGYAAGDFTVPGIGMRPLDQVRPEERTTPAGRFLTQPGRNAIGEQVVWVDYDAAVSMHAVRTTNPKERRLERLASPSAGDRRISWGCINLPAAFFKSTVWPNLGLRRGVVYVLPEQQPLKEFFPRAVPSPA